MTTDHRTWQEGFTVSQSVPNMCSTGGLGQAFVVSISFSVQ